MASNLRTRLNLMSLEVRTVPTALPFATEIALVADNHSAIVAAMPGIESPQDPVFDPEKREESLTKPNPRVDGKLTDASKLETRRATKGDYSCFPPIQLPVKKAPVRDIKVADAANTLGSGDRYW